MDLPKAFDTLNKNSLLVKLNAHEFFFNTVNDLTKYNKLFNRTFSKGIYKQSFYWVMQNTLASATRLIFFHTFIKELFFFIQEAYICNLADDNSS